MGRLHHRIVDSKFGSRYLEIKQSISRINHLIHGGIENYYAGLEIPHLRSHGAERLCDESIERTLQNIELGLGRVMGVSIASCVQIECHPRLPQGQKMREALWEYSISNGAEQLAAVGANLHLEGESIVATIANIQGQHPDVEKLRERYANMPWPVVTLPLIIESLPDDVEVVRGIASRNHPFVGEGLTKHQASNVYDRTFRRLGFSPIRDAQGKVEYYEALR